MSDRSTISIPPEHAARFQAWLRTRGGVALWSSTERLSDPGFSMSTPANAPDGTPYARPHWKLGATPQIITDPAAFHVETLREVRRFRVAIRLGRQGFTFKCTDASTAKIRQAVEKAGDGATYQFDYATQEAVILVPTGDAVPLTEWPAKDSE